MLCQAVPTCYKKWHPRTRRLLKGIFWKIFKVVWVKSWVTLRYLGTVPFWSPALFHVVVLSRSFLFPPSSSSVFRESGVRPVGVFTLSPVRPGPSRWNRCSVQLLVVSWRFFTCPELTFLTLRFFVGVRDPGGLLGNFFRLPLRKNTFVVRPKKVSHYSANFWSSERRGKTGFLSLLSKNSLLRTQLAQLGSWLALDPWWTPKLRNSWNKFLDWVLKVVSQTLDFFWSFSKKRKDFFFLNLFNKLVPLLGVGPCRL